MEDKQSLINSLLSKYKLPVGLSLIGIVLILGGIFTNNNKSRLNSASNFPKESIVSPKENLIAVDIAGAVNKSGVIKVQEGTILEDVVKLAGGFSSNSNQEYISKNINLAKKVSDGMKIYIPFKGEQGIVSQESGVLSATTSKKEININSSTQADLESLTGIGPATAQKIISGRPYQKVDELLNKKIVPKATFEKIKDSLTI